MKDLPIDLDLTLREVVGCECVRVRVDEDGHRDTVGGALMSLDLVRGGNMGSILELM